MDGPPISGDFDAVWPDVQRRLERSLRRRGIDGETSRDIAQDVAERAVRFGVPYESAGDLYRWAWTVGTRLSIDHRRRAWRVTGEAVPEQVSTVNVERVVESREALEEVVRFLEGCSEPDRRAIVSAVTGETWPDRRESVRWAVRRHAVRARLHAALDRLAVVLGLRRFARWSEYGADPSAVAVANLLVPLFALVLPVLWPGESPHTRGAGTVAQSSGSTPVLVARAAPVSSAPPAPPVERQGTPLVLSATTTGGPPPELVHVAPPVGPAVGARIIPERAPDAPIACVENPPLLPGQTYCVPRPVVTPL